MAHFCSMCGPKFCSMEITHQIRKMQADSESNGISDSDNGQSAVAPEKVQHGTANGAGLPQDPEALAGMEQKSREFREMGSKIYVESDRE